MSRKQKTPGKLFEIEPSWKDSWEGMPEYISSNDLMPVQQVIINFLTEEDISQFAKLVQQTITQKTRSLWYPKAKIESIVTKRFAAINKDKPE